jgi:uncharacterized membrane protein HdeD (DUF308 family)
MPRTSDPQEPLVQRPAKQLVIGLVLLVVGVVLAVSMVRSKATVSAGVGFAMAIAGIVLVGNAVLLRSRR